MYMYNCVCIYIYIYIFNVVSLTIHIIVSVKHAICNIVAYHNNL